MSESADREGPPSPEDAAERRRGRLRLAALAALVGFWLAPWAKVQGPDGGTVSQAWAHHAGVVGGLALVALWGLCATALLARTRRGRRVGAALTDGAVAFATTGLLVMLHEWLPGGALRETWVPIFAPLGILGALDAFVTFRRPDAGNEITLLRSGAALFAAAALVVKAEWVPAGVAAWLGASALAHAKARRPGSVRRVVEVQVLVAACLAILAPVIHSVFFGKASPVEEFHATAWGWTLLALAVAVTAAVGIVGPPPGRADPATA